MRDPIEEKARAEVARRWTWPHVNHERGQGWQVVGFWPSYRAPYIAWGLGGNGWKSAPRRAFVKGGWEYWCPYVYIGLLGGFQRAWYPGEVSLPATLVRRWRWLTRPGYRKAMTEDPIAVDPTSRAEVER